MLGYPQHPGIHVLANKFTLFSDCDLLVKIPCHCFLVKLVTIACYASLSCVMVCREEEGEWLF